MVSHFRTGVVGHLGRTTGKDYKGSFWSDGIVPRIDLSGSHTGTRTLKMHQPVLLRFVLSTRYKLHFNLKIYKNK